MKNDYFFIFLSVFVFFPQAFGLVNECHILNLHEVIRALHLVACWIVFLLFDDWYWQGGVPKLMKNDHCLAFLALSVFSFKFWPGQGVTYVKTAQNKISVTYSCLPNCFYFILFPSLAGRSVQNYEKWSFFSIFSRFGPFPQVSGQVKEWLMLKLHKIITMSHVVAFPIGFIFLIVGIGREECSKLGKMINFLYFYQFWSFSPSFWAG